MNQKKKTPWPTKAAMQQIYEQKLWGGKDVDFYSGEGSHHLDIVEPYLKAVISFLKNKKLSVCDLGCGDFNIGQHLIKYTKNYIAIDIVERLIERNQNHFKAYNLEFQCLNIAADKLPNADCVILRQVLQHLSNAEIASITKKLNAYKYIILTEHLPVGDFISNKDIISGQGIRLKQQSGVNLFAAPFNLKVKNETILNEVTVDKGRIVTTLYTLF